MFRGPELSVSPCTYMYSTSSCFIFVPFSELSDETTEVKFEVFDKEKPPGSKNRELRTA